MKGKSTTPGTRGRGRPAISDAEKARRGTFQPSRARDKGTRPAQARRKTAAAKARDFPAIARGYVSDVLAGRIVACRYIQLACERHVRDMHRAATDRSWPYVWSDAHAVDACAFVEQLPHVEGRWSTETIRLEPWQVFLLASLFGWRQRSDPARRRFTTLFWECARKAAKSTLAAAIILYHLLREDEPGATAVCAASTGQQARIVFSIAQRMVRRAPWLRLAGLTALANSIITADGVVKPINAKSSSQDGLNPSLICLDESHAQDFGLHDVLKSSQGARVNPLLIAPTTAGHDLLSVGYALHSTVTKILEQVFEAEHVFGLIYTLDPEDDWRDERVWIKANPMLGISPTFAFVRNYCLDAQQTPGGEAEFLVKVCSRWLQAASAWLSMTQWDTCGDPALTLEQFVGERCWLGGDLAQLDDLAAIAILFERKGVLYAFVKFYLPEGVVVERARAVPAYFAWARDGIVKTTAGPMIDYTVIEDDVRALCKRFKVQAIAFDQFGSTHLVSRLAADHLPAVIEAKNAKTFTPPARELETRVKHGKLRHDGNQCLKWMASNVVVTRGIDDSILPKKESATSPNKIDGIDALLQAIGAFIREPAARHQRPPIYFMGGQ